jgi:dienelactone hydrolase
MRSDVELDSGGVTLRGWLYRPETDSPPPVVVMGHGFSGVKEMSLDDYAADFCDRGLAVLVIDYAGFGASDGEPRQEVDPFRQLADYRSAVSYAQSRPDLDGAHVGVWGSSYGGGHAIMMAATDPRVTCAVAQVPYTGSRGRSALPASVLERVDDDARRRADGQAPEMVPIVSEDPDTYAVVSGDPKAYHYFTRTAEKRAPAWRNEVTLASVALMLDYQPLQHAADVRIPVLVITASRDVLTTPKSARRLADALGEHAEYVELDGAHFDVYNSRRPEGSAAASSFFLRHLAPTERNKELR